MWREEQFKLLKNEIEAILSDVPASAGFASLLREAVDKTGFRLTDNRNNSYPWVLLALTVSESISGHYEDTLPVAAVLLLLKSSAEVFDDIEDADSSDSLSNRYGSAVATNAATTLLILAERGITRLKERNVKPHTIIRTIEAINSFYIDACAGQHLDLTSTPKVSLSEDFYLQAAKMKSASTVSCACHVGALLANASKKIINQFTEFGYNIGIASQIANDIIGITQKDDTFKLKISLPVIYALSQTEGKVHDYIEDFFIKRSNLNFDPLKVKKMLFNSGAIQYTTVIMEYYKQKAIDILLEIEKAHINIERLKIFL